MFANVFRIVYSTKEFVATVGNSISIKKLDNTVGSIGSPEGTLQLRVIYVLTGTIEICI